VERLAVDFEQHCEDADAALFGALRYNSTVSTLIPFDGGYPDYRLTIAPPAHGSVTGDGVACSTNESICTRSLIAPRWRSHAPVAGDLVVDLVQRHLVDGTSLGVATREAALAAIGRGVPLRHAWNLALEGDWR